MNFNERVYAAVRLIPCGRVATYGQIARMVGSPRASRVVGSALHRNPYEPGVAPPELVVPCHRVVNRNGGLASGFAFDGPYEQMARLIAEGVEVRPDMTVDLTKCLWDGK